MMNCLYTILTFAAMTLSIGPARFASGAEPPPPLTTVQVEQVRTLIKRTQTEQTRLKTELTRSQKELAACYDIFELDEPQVEKLQKEIVELQRGLLASHHSMQIELRTIVGEERFKILSKRIANALRSPNAPPNE